jgi:hypothetical protein
LDLQLSMQSVPITTIKDVSSNHAHGEMYSIQLYVIKFVSDLRQVGGFLRDHGIYKYDSVFFAVGYKMFFMNIWSVFPRELQYQNVAYFQCSHFGHSQHKSRVRYRVMLLNTTFNNILVISWRSVFLVEETGVPGENHWPKKIIELSKILATYNNKLILK